MSLSLKSRAQGAIWGVCVADALGGPVQFQDPGTFEPIRGLNFVAPYEQPAGYDLPPMNQEISLTMDQILLRRRCYDAGFGMLFLQV
jgi:hypothetical protein